MDTQPLVPDPKCLTLDRLSIAQGAIVFQVRPWQGNTVRIEMNCRKFFCDNRQCERRVFAASVAVRYARKTARLAEALQELT